MVSKAERQTKNYFQLRERWLLMEKCDIDPGMSIIEQLEGQRLFLRLLL